MNKKRLWYVGAVLLCCSLAFVSYATLSGDNSATKQSVLNKLAKSKAELIASGQSAEFAAKLRTLNGQGSTVDPSALSRRAPQGYVPAAPQADNRTVTKSWSEKDAYQELLNILASGQELTPDQKTEFVNLEETLFPQDRNTNSLDDVGGPSSFGYYWVDNLGGDSATYAWEEPTTPTELTTLASSDDGFELCTWGFNFSFFGTNYTSGYVTTNGYVALGAGSGDWSNDCPRSAGTPTGPTIFPFWDDGHATYGASSDGGRVVYQIYADHVTITWDSLGACCTAGADILDYQVQLWNNGKIKMQYRQIQGLTGTSVNGRSATIGIQQSNTGGALDYLTYHCATAMDSAYTNALDGRAIWFYLSTATTGRCCYGDVCAPTCVEDVTATDCSTLGGTFTLDGLCPCPVPAAGDQICNAIVVGGLPYSNDGTTCGFNNNYDEVCPYGGSLSPDVVYEYTPLANQTVDISLCQGTTNYDTKLYVYENTYTPGFPFACNDDACTAPLYASPYVSSLLSQNLTGGNTYYIVVDGYGSACGNYTLLIEDAVPCIIDCGPFDDVEPAESDSCNREDADPNGGCNMAIPQFNTIACGDTFCGESFSYDSCGNPAVAYRDTDWHTLTLTQQTDLTITGTAEFPNLIIFLTTGDCGTLTVLGNTSGSALPCDVVSLSVECLAPGTYYIVSMINGFGANGGAPYEDHLKYRLWVDCPAAVCVPPANDACEDAIEIVVPNNGSGSALVSNQYAGNSCTDVCELTSTGPDQFFYFTLTSCRLIAITADPNDPHISVYNNGDCCGTAILCNDDWSAFDITGLEGWLNPTIYPVSSLGSMVADSLPAGTYYIRAGEWGGGWNGDYTLTVYDFGPCVPLPCDPVVDLRVTAEYVGNVADHYKLWFTAPQDEDYTVWYSTNPNNDGDPDGGSDPDFAIATVLLGVTAGPVTYDAPAGFDTYRYFVVTAGCEPYSPPVGRCCYDNNTQCADLTQADCAEIGGTWGGSFVNCLDDPCPPPLPTGRCCYNGGVDCAVNYETDCIGLAGTWTEGLDCNTACGQAPANDDCGSAIEVFNATPVPGTNVDATGTDLSSCVFTDPFDVWYYYVATTTDPITLTLCDVGTDFDTGLAVYDACGGGELACNDDNSLCTGNTLTSLVTFTPAATGTFYIRVSGFNSQTGSFVLTVTQ